MDFATKEMSQAAHTHPLCLGFWDGPCACTREQHKATLALTSPQVQTKLPLAYMCMQLSVTMPIRAMQQCGTCSLKVPMPPYPVEGGRCRLQAPHKLTGNPRMMHRRVASGHRKVCWEKHGVAPHRQKGLGAAFPREGPGTHPATGAKGCPVRGTVTQPQ